MEILIAATIILMLIVWIVSVYNNLVSVSNKIEEARDNLRALILRVEAIWLQSTRTVGHTSEDEMKFQSEIAKAKTGDLTGSSLIAVAEAFPISVSTSIRQDLIQEFNRLELQINDAVKRHNHFVNALNTLTEVFPNNIFISMFFNKFKKIEYIGREKLHSGFEG